MKKERANLPASVHDRLLRWAKQHQEEYQAVLTRYCLERFLYRLGQSPHRPKFVLKGALLFVLWTGQAHRPTKDLDLLSRGDDSIEVLEQLLQDICDQTVEEDGMTFLAETVQGERIREGEEYQGVRLHFVARRGTARVRLQTDVGFGDAITPQPQLVTFPTMLEFPAPVLLAYPRETAVAEKFQALVMLGMLNTRMKDFWDLANLARQFAFQGPLLCRAIGATFARRKTALPQQPPVALTDAFFGNKAKQKDWQAFLKRSKLEAQGLSLEGVAAGLRDFLMPPTRAVAEGRPFAMAWPPNGPWTPAQPV
jgi:hypothetical protein